MAPGLAHKVRTIKAVNKTGSITIGFTIAEAAEINRCASFEDPATRRC